MNSQLSIQLDRFNFDKKDENLLIDKAKEQILYCNMSQFPTNKKQHLFEFSKTKNLYKFKLE